MFGLLVVANAVTLGQFLYLAFRTGYMGLLFEVLANPLRIVEILAYFAATLWLIFSPGIRSLCCQPRLDRSSG
jgi:hypothetical protein